MLGLPLVLRLALVYTLLMFTFVVVGGRLPKPGHSIYTHVCPLCWAASGRIPQYPASMWKLASYDTYPCSAATGAIGCLNDVKVDIYYCGNCSHRGYEFREGCPVHGGQTRYVAADPPAPPPGANN
jgi:hypothetical protein